jgi:hypothetical protein
MGLPARLGDAWNFACEREPAEADPTQREAADERARPAAQLTAIMLLGFEPRRALRFDDQRFFGHVAWPPV